MISFFKENELKMKTVFYYFTYEIEIDIKILTYVLKMYSIISKNKDFLFLNK